MKKTKIKYIINAKDKKLPVGSVLQTTQKIPKKGWLVPDGKKLKKQDYPKLYEVIKEVYGGNETHFNLPDLRIHRAKYQIIFKIFGVDFYVKAKGKLPQGFWNKLGWLKYQMFNGYNQ